MNCRANVEGRKARERNVGVGTTAMNIACTLGPAGRCERQQLLGRLLTRAAGRRELDQGCAFAFPADLEASGEVVAVTEPQRGCCPFLPFMVTVEPEGGGGPISLDLSGSETGSGAGA